MQNLVNGIVGWARMDQADKDSVQVVDAAITVVGTLLVALAWAMVKR
jgi:hypothetical protein